MKMKKKFIKKYKINQQTWMILFMPNLKIKFKVLAYMRNKAFLKTLLQENTLGL